MPNTGSTQLSWTNPTTNTDGSALTDLAGIDVYAGRATGSYTDPRSPVVLGVVTTTNFNVDAVGAWFFAFAAFNSVGQISALSSEISATFTVASAASLIGIF